MVEIVKSGMYTTIQDQGRSGYAHLGVPISGAMDALSAAHGNLLLGNEENAATMECTLIGPELLFHKETNIAITGGLVQPFVNGRPISMYTQVQIKKGDLLSFGRMAKGARYYIAIAGGYLSDKIMGSRSACITSGILTTLAKGDTLSYLDPHTPPEISIMPVQHSSRVIAVHRGPEYDQLSTYTPALQRIAQTPITILPESNRMAIRTAHTLPLTHTASLLSSPTLPGTVQLTPSGDLIILMRDAQTTGGYPRILQLTESSICRIAQLRAGSTFTFELLSAWSPSSTKGLL